jgi:hypothetical protein
MTDQVLVKLRHSSKTLERNLAELTKFRGQSHVRSFALAYGLVVVSAAQLWAAAWLYGVPEVQGPHLDSILVFPVVVGIVGLFASLRAAVIITYFRRRARGPGFVATSKSLSLVNTMIAERTGSAIAYPPANRSDNHDI